MLLDSNIIIGYLNNDSSIVNKVLEWKRSGQILFLSTIVEAEILSFSKWNYKTKQIVNNFLDKNFVSISFDKEIAKITGDIRSLKKIRLPDAAIAATAMFLKVPLVTRNIKDFKNIFNLLVYKI